MTELTSLLVGMHFHPPAKLLLASLPAGASLQLQREPDNPYDENAISVWLSPGEIPESQHSKLDEELGGFGFDLAEILQGEALMLGHVAATGGKPLKGTSYAGNLEVLELLGERGLDQLEVKLGFSPEGKPLLHIRLV